MKSNVLGASTAITRKLVLLIIERNAHSLSAAKEVVSAARREPGDFSHVVLKRDVPAAFELAEQIRKIHSMRRGRVGFRTHQWYGGRRTQPQSAADRNRRMDRARLAERFRTEPLRHRLAVQRRMAVLEAAQRVMKYGASGGSRWEVGSGDEPDYHVEVVKDWARVNKGRDTWASNVDHHHITVSRSWLAVHKRIGDGTAIVDGRFLLDAKLFLDAGDRKIWEASLARSGRGFQAVVEQVWVSAYGRDVTVDKDLKRALAAPPPAGFTPVDPALLDQDEAYLAELVA
ncbi:hypothetical protein MKL09_29200 [Methylobacterium sp. J-048]|uniref:hypothetical protein n=1 Tax=Methylobacterium sp. J-048 TaxID=2836635 RepID=UPI001FB8F730|nr:hypothetical protein [Methylobacterium sp. J-048]MCJ2060589.1 hypothetical protein [Methylobacterium sp. J-048]